jgi:hypothetical protein
MLKLKLLLTAVVFVGFAGTVAAQDSNRFSLSVAQLQEQCQANTRLAAADATNDRSHLKETDWAAGAACLGYVLGTIDAILAGGIFVNSKDGKTVYSHYYVPDSITGGQGCSVFLKYLQNHPEANVQKSARSVLIQSWIDAKLIAVSVLSAEASR